MAAVTGLDSKPFIMLIISAFCNGDIRQQMTEAQSLAKFRNNGTLKNYQIWQKNLQKIEERMPCCICIKIG